jgi:hypothetical protein
MAPPNASQKGASTIRLEGPKCQRKNSDPVEYVTGFEKRGNLAQKI